MLDDILTSFADHDIHGATILDSKGMVHLWRLTATRARFRFRCDEGILKPERENSNLIIAAVNDDHVENAVKAIEDVIGDLSKPDTGVVFTVPISYVKGLYKDGN